MKPRIYDCFCFFNEHDLLKLRLETLWNVVDVFVLVESSLTFSGKPKPVYYNASLLGPYSDKIRHIVVDEFPFPISDPWRNERFQRNAIERGLTDLSDHDWVVIGDVDEIPNPEKLREFNPGKFIRGDFLQKNYGYYINNCNVDENQVPIIWRGSKITTYQNFRDFFKSAERVRSFKSSGVLRAFKREWFHRFQVQGIPEGGWHFSWMSGLESIISKLESFSHQEFNTAEIKDPKRIMERIRAGEDILKTGAKFKLFPLDETFPRPLHLNQTSYRHLLLSYDEDASSAGNASQPL